MNYVHHAGRLRLKFPDLIGHQNLARAVEKAIRPLPGVQLVQVNTFTGSLLIHYESRGARESAMLEAVDALLTRQFGLPLSARLSGPAARQPIEPMQPMQQPVSQHSRWIADQITDMVVQKIVERSALALLGALL